MNQDIELNLDNDFIQRVVNNITHGILPVQIPTSRMIDIIIEAANWFWTHVDQSVEERCYIIKNSEFTKQNAFNKIVKLPSQVMSIHGVFKTTDSMGYGAMGDFSMERMLVSSYSSTGGGGILGDSNYKLSDAVISMYEIDTFNQTLNPPVSYNYNEYSSTLIILGDLGATSDVVIQCMVRCKIQDLYNSGQFFKLVCAYCRRELADIYSTFSFKLPGNIEINTDNMRSSADSDIEEIKIWAENTTTCSYFMMPNVM